MLAFVYRGDVYCERCAHKLGLPIDDEYVDEVAGEFDTDYEEADYPMHCTNCGMFLENALTGEGERYVLEHVRYAIENDNITPVIEEWMRFYDYLAYMLVWMKMGEGAEYESFRHPYEAGVVLGEFMKGKDNANEYIRGAYYDRDRQALYVYDYFDRDNFIFLYWGDEDAGRIKSLSTDDVYEFKRGALSIIAPER